MAPGSYLQVLIAALRNSKAVVERVLKKWMPVFGG